MAFGQIVDLVCRNSRPNLQWRLALAKEWSQTKKTAKKEVLLYINHL
jgi:hypothetical protein